ncbi:cbb3-type cytochrome c oxidase subunit 3 [Paroceanicella profunda]|uniref:Cbb3-type cytochrome c oxidase subunit 3 n=1 Tax=Paroceanicella profunda TaxID=2579971 RepID=A0A5B8G0X7_9RHOB|nr:cbb3-type cytochrome c oxidase subunit 3 [Paroceanicella profunda]QDL92702.1 cbb3-type cytochrome c oxidase subunit 3 [Paroceanicella profunda]
MDTYTILRHFADSWFLLLMFGFFLAAVGFAFRPGARKIHDDVASIPLRNDDFPAGKGD